MPKKPKENRKLTTEAELMRSLLELGPMTREELANTIGSDGRMRAVLRDVRLHGIPVVSSHIDGKWGMREYRIAKTWDEYRPFRAEMISRIRSIAEVIRAMDSGMKYLDPTIVRLLDETEVE